MKLDIVDTVLSSFDRLASKATLGVIGAMIALFLALGIGFAAGGALMTVSSILGGLVMLVTLIGYIAGSASLTLGIFRAFDQKDFSKEMFTENILWPFLRFTGSNITIQALAFGVAYILLYPILLVGLFTGSMASIGSVGATPGLSALSTGLMAGMGLLGLITLGIVLYLLSALIISLPRIAVDDKRLFQALDESVQTTKGNRIGIIATILPSVILVALGLGALFQLGETAGMIVYTVALLAGFFYMPAILTELNSRLK